MKKSALIIGLILAVFISFTSCTKKQASSEAGPANAVDALKARGVLIIGYDVNFPPLAFEDDTGTLVGYDVELAKEVSSRIGVQLKAIPIDWDDKDNELENGTIDCVWSGYTITEPRKKAHSLTFPYLTNEQVLIVRKTGAVQSYDDLKGRVIGYRSSSSSEVAVDDNASFKNMLGDIITYKTTQGALNDLKVGVIDAMVMDSVFAYYYTTKTSEPFAVITTPLNSEEYAICFRKNEPELRDEVEKILLQMASDGTIEAISNKWFGQDVSLIGK